MSQDFDPKEYLSSIGELPEEAIETTEPERRRVPGMRQDVTPKPDMLSTLRKDITPGSADHDELQIVERLLASSDPALKLRGEDRMFELHRGQTGFLKKSGKTLASGTGMLVGGIEKANNMRHIVEGATKKAAGDFAGMGLRKMGLDRMASSAEGYGAMQGKTEKWKAGVHNKVGDYLLDKSGDLAPQGDYQHGITESLKRGRIGEAGGQLYYSALQNAPQLALSLTGVGIPVIGASAVGQKYDELENDETLTEGQRWLNAVGTGLGEAGSEVFGKFIPGGKQAGKAAVEAGKKALAKTLLKAAGSQFKEEALEEGLAQVSENLIDMYMGVKRGGEDVTIFMDVPDAMIVGGTVGGGMGIMRGANDVRRGRNQGSLDRALGEEPDGPILDPETGEALDLGGLGSDTLVDGEGNPLTRDSVKDNPSGDGTLVDDDGVVLVDEAGAPLTRESFPRSTGRSPGSGGVKRNPNGDGTFVNDSGVLLVDALGEPLTLQAIQESGQSVDLNGVATFEEEMLRKEGLPDTPREGAQGRTVPRAPVTYKENKQGRWVVKHADTGANMLGRSFKSEEDARAEYEASAPAETNHEVGAVIPGQSEGAPPVVPPPVGERDLDTKKNDYGVHYESEMVNGRERWGAYDSDGNNLYPGVSFDSADKVQAFVVGQKTQYGEDTPDNGLTFNEEMREQEGDTSFAEAMLAKEETPPIPGTEQKGDSEAIYEEDLMPADVPDNLLGHEDKDAEARDANTAAIESLREKGNDNPTEKEVRKEIRDMEKGKKAAKKDAERVENAQRKLKEDEAQYELPEDTPPPLPPQEPPAGGGGGTMQDPATAEAPSVHNDMDRKEPTDEDAVREESEPHDDVMAQEPPEEVNTEPTEAQKEAGNYKKAHIKRDSFDVTIENPAGSERSGIDGSGKAWKQTMHQDYGYIRGSKGADGDHVDVFIKPDSPEGGSVFIVDQVNPETGAFDEHKVMMGFDDVTDAADGYNMNYEKGWKGLHDITEMPMDEFKVWVKDKAKTKKPAGEAPEVKAAETTEQNSSGINKVPGDKKSTPPAEPTTEAETKKPEPTDTKEVAGDKPADKPKTKIQQEVDKSKDRTREKSREYAKKNPENSVTPDEVRTALEGNPAFLPEDTDIDALTDRVNRAMEQKAQNNWRGHQVKERVVQNAIHKAMDKNDEATHVIFDTIKDKAPTPNRDGSLPDAKKPDDKKKQAQGNAKAIIDAAGIKEKLLANTKYANAVKNSDKQNARIELSNQLDKIMPEYIKPNPDLYKRYTEDKEFKKYMQDYLFHDTYTKPKENREAMDALMSGRDGEIPEKTPEPTEPTETQENGIIPEEQEKQENEDTTGNAGNTGTSVDMDASDRAPVHDGPKTTERVPAETGEIPGISGESSSASGTSPDTTTGQGKADDGSVGSSESDNVSRPGRGGSTESTDGSTSQDGGVRGETDKRTKGRNHKIENGAVVAPPGQISKIQANIAALKLLKKIEAEDRLATKAEQAILVRYTGWGHSPQVFDKIKDAKSWSSDSADVNWRNKFKKYFDEVKEMLTEDEWDSAADSTLWAHYTSTDAIDFMWAALRRFGFDGGTILEPAMGVGHFFGRIPAQYADNKLVGVEIDNISFRISRQLYQNATLFNQGFEEVDTPPNSVDLAITNVPFNQEGVADGTDRYGRHLNLHNYFIARMLDAVKPGGMVVTITSAHTLDSAKEQRELLAEKGDLVAAIRLPNTAFKQNADTSVVTDILFLRKPDGNKASGTVWVPTQNITIEGKSWPVNKYFADHPDMMLGTPSLDGSMYGGKDEFTVNLDANEIKGQLSEAIAKLPKKIYGEYFAENTDFDALKKESGIEQDSIYLEDGQYYIIVEKKKHKLENMGSKFTQKPTKARVPLYVALRDHYAKHVELMADESASSKSFSDSLQKLNKLYDDWFKKAGALNGINGSVFSIDSAYYSMIGLEDVKKRYNAEGDEITEYVKNDVFTKNTLTQVKEPTDADSLDDAVKLSLGFKGEIDIKYISSLTGKSKDAVTQSLLDAEYGYIDPVLGYVVEKDAYRSGNVVKKLEAARDAEDLAPGTYTKNIKALKAVQPDPLYIKEVNLGASWLPVEILQDWARSTFQSNFGTVSYNEDTGIWTVEGFNVSSNAQSLWGTRNVQATSILEKTLNLKKIVARVRTSEGSYTDTAQTTLANRIAFSMRKQFQKDMLSTPEKAAIVNKAYNDEQNVYVLRKYDGKHLKLPGAAESLNLRPYQKDVVWRLIQEGRGMLAHAVGAGKTRVLVATTMELRRLGLANKPMIVVQNETLKQFAADFSQFYPGARVLVATEKEFSGNRRRHFFSRISSGNYDAIVIAQSSFDLIKVSPEFERQDIVEQIRDHEQAMIDLGADPNAEPSRKDSPTVKQLRKRLRALRAKLERLMAKSEDLSDTSIYWEELGVDTLIIDEAHEYKKPPIVTRMDDIKGLNKEHSIKAHQAALKAKHVREKMNKRGVILATGTPISTTLGELYSLSTLIAPDVLKAHGINNFDEFVNTYGKIEPETLPDQSGEMETKSVLKRFADGPSLMRMVFETWDSVTSEDLRELLNNEGVGLPEMEGGRPQNLIVPLSDGAEQIMDMIMDVIRAYKRQLNGQQRRQWSWINGTTYQLGVFATLDPRLIIPSLPDEDGSKVSVLSQQVKKVYDDTSDVKGTQIIFADRRNQYDTSALLRFMDEFNIEAPDGLRGAKSLPADFIHKEIKRKLIEEGVPEGEIALIGDYKKGPAREKIKERVRKGEIRVIVGTTASLGVGVNIQDRMAASWSLDPPMNFSPTMEEQRQGRTVRQGNMFKTVKISNVVMKGTNDHLISTDMLRKSVQYKQILSPKNIDQWSFEDPTSANIHTLEEMAMSLSRDPLVAEMMKLEAEARDLRIDRDAFEKAARDRVNSRLQLQEDNQRISSQQIPKQEQIGKATKDFDPEKAVLKLHGREYIGTEAIKEALNPVMQKEADRIFRAIQAGRLPATTRKNAKDHSYEVFSGELDGTAITAYAGAYVVNVNLNEWQQMRTVEFKWGDHTLSYNLRNAGSILNRMGTLSEEMDRAIKRSKETLDDNKKQIKYLDENTDGEWEDQDQLTKIDARLEEIKAERGNTDDDDLFTPEDDDDLGGDPPTGGTRYSETTRPRSGGMSALDVQTATEKASSAWPDVNVKIVQSQSELPDGVRPEKGRVVRGAYSEGMVYLVADNITSAKEAQFTLLHEVVGHKGVRMALNESKVKADGYFKQLSIARRKEVKAYAESKGMPFDTTEQKMIAAEEWLADRVGNGDFGKLGTFWNKLLNLLNRMVNKVFGNEVFDDNELAHIVSRGEVILEGKANGLDTASRYSTTAFQGTPLTEFFDAHDSNLIGSGEGSQYFGWGHYFADNKGVAKWYRDLKRDPHMFKNMKIGPISVTGEEVGDLPDTDTWIETSVQEALVYRVIVNNYFELAHAYDAKGEDGAKEFILKEVRALTYDLEIQLEDEETDSGELSESAQFIVDQLALVSTTTKDDISFEHVASPITGRLYEVDLAPKEDEYLLWHEPIFEEGSDKVIEALKTVNTPFRKIAEERERIMRQIQERYPDALKDLSYVLDMAHDDISGVLSVEALHYADILPDEKFRDDILAQIYVYQRAFVDSSIVTGEDIYRQMTDWYEPYAPKSLSRSRHGGMSESKRWAQKPVSLALLKAGIRGNKFIDGPSRRGKKGIEYNYVIFDDSDISITARYSEVFQEDQGKVKEWIESWVGNRDVNHKPDLAPLDTVLRTPSFYADKIPALRRVVDAGERLRDDKHHYENLIFEDSLGNSELGLIDRYSKKNKKEWKRLESYLFERDRQADGYFVIDKGDSFTLYDPDHQEVRKFDDEDMAWEAAFAHEARALVASGYSEDAARTLLAVRHINARDYKQLMSTATKAAEEYEKSGQDAPVTEWNGEAVSIFEALKGMGDLRGSYMPRLRSGSQYLLYADKVGSPPLMEVFDTKLGRRARSKKLTKDGYTTREVLSTQPSEESYLDSSLVALNDMVQHALTRMEKLGDKSHDFSTFGLEVGMETYHRKTDGLDEEHFVLRGVNRNRYKELYKDFGGHWYERDDAWHFVKPAPGFEDNLLKAIAHIEYGENTMVGVFGHAMMGQIATIVHSRGSRSRKIERRGDEEVYRGYEENALKALTMAGKATAGGTAKREMAKTMMKAIMGTDVSWDEYKAKHAPSSEESMSDTERRSFYQSLWAQYMGTVQERRIDSAIQPLAFKEARSYMNEMLRNEENSERVVGAIKGLASAKYLSGLAPGLVNLTALGTTVPAAMHTFGGIPFAKAPRLLARGIKDYHTHYMYNKFGKGKGHTGEKAWLFGEINDRGWDEAQYNIEAVAALQNRLERGSRTFIDTMLLPFAMTEKLNRGSTIAAAYFGIKAGHTGVWDEKAQQVALTMAKKISDRGHGVYGKSNLPPWARGSGLGPQTLRSFYMFKTFAHNYMQLLFEMGFRDRKAAAFMLASPAILAGPGAMVLTPVVSGIIKAIYAGLGLEPPENPEEDMYLWAEERFGPTAGDTARYGLMGTAGLSIRGSLSPGFEMPRTVMEAMGAPGSVAQDMWYGAGDILTGDIYKGLERMAPRVIAAPMKGYREYDEGITTRSNAPVFFNEEPLKADMRAAMYRSLGFNPVSIAGPREKLWEEKKRRGTQTARKSDIYARMRRWYHNGQNPAEWIDLLDMKNEYNAYVERLGDEKVKPILDSTIKRVLSGMEP